jgi:sRNA-binding carbon storage regulator CsrA
MPLVIQRSRRQWLHLETRDGPIWVKVKPASEGGQIQVVIDAPRNVIVSRNELLPAHLRRED